MWEKSNAINHKMTDHIPSGNGFIVSSLCYNRWITLSAIMVEGEGVDNLPSGKLTVCELETHHLQ